MKTISDELLSRMASQCKLTNQEFIQLVECPLNRDGYEKKLVDSGVIKLKEESEKEIKSDEKSKKQKD